MEGPTATISASQEVEGAKLTSQISKEVFDRESTFSTDDSKSASKEIEDKGESKLLSLEVPGSPRVLFAREKTSSTVGSNSRKVLRRERTRGAQHFAKIATKNVSSAVPANTNKRSTFQKRFSICPEPEHPIPGSAFRTHRQ